MLLHRVLLPLTVVEVLTLPGILGRQREIRFECELGVEEVFIGLHFDLDLALLVEPLKRQCLYALFTSIRVLKHDVSDDFCTHLPILFTLFLDLIRMLFR